MKKLKKKHVILETNVYNVSKGQLLWSSQIEYHKSTIEGKHWKIFMKQLKIQKRNSIMDQTDLGIKIK